MIRSTQCRPTFNPKTKNSTKNWSGVGGWGGGGGGGGGGGEGLPLHLRFRLTCDSIVM